MLTSGCRRSVPRSIARDVASGVFARNTRTFATLRFVPISIRRFANSSSFSVKYITFSVLIHSHPHYLQKLYLINYPVNDIKASLLLGNARWFYIDNPVNRDETRRNSV